MYLRIPNLLSNHPMMSKVMKLVTILSACYICSPTLFQALTYLPIAHRLFDALCSGERQLVSSLSVEFDRIAQPIVKEFQIELHQQMRWAAVNSYRKYGEHNCRLLDYAGKEQKTGMQKLSSEMDRVSLLFAFDQNVHTVVRASKFNTMWWRRLYANNNGTDILPAVSEHLKAVSVDRKQAWMLKSEVESEQVHADLLDSRTMATWIQNEDPIPYRSQHEKMVSILTELTVLIGSVRVFSHFQ